MRKMILVPLILFSLGCAESAATGKALYFNTEEFTGLVSLGSSYEEGRLDYELDGSDGSSIKFQSCTQVDQTEEDQVETSQFKLFRLLAANCFAVKHYSAAERPSRSFIPEALTKEFISHLPAQAVPQIGGDEFATRSGKTLEHHENSLNVSGTNEYAATVVLGDGMEIDYIVMARGDFDGDDVEDLILRLDRNIPEAFGSGFSAIAISRTSDSGEIEIVSRYPD